MKLLKTTRLSLYVQLIITNAFFIIITSEIESLATDERLESPCSETEKILNKTLNEIKQNHQHTATWSPSKTAQINNLNTA